MGKLIINLSSVTTVGLDLAKHVFQVHGVDASGRVVVTKAMRRNKLLEFFASLPPCLVGLEASGSAHHWARELMALGHEARMMPPAYVKPYIRRQNNDASDAAAICEAVTPPSMRFVGVVKVTGFTDALDDTPARKRRLRGKCAPLRHAIERLCL